MEEETPPAPTLIPFGDAQDWIVNIPMVYAIGTGQHQITVPRGFVTDFASIPPLVQRITGLTPYGQYSRAAIIHDWLYWTQGCTRAQADRLMVLAMKESATESLEAVTIYRALQAAGGFGWRANQQKRAAGDIRVIPEAYLPPWDPNMRWDQFHRWLKTQGVTDPVFEKAPGYCQCGNTLRVP